MKIELLQENEDGSADIQLNDVEPHLMQIILQTGLLKILEDTLDQMRKDNKIPALFKEKPNAD